MREREAATVSAYDKDGKINVTLTHSLDKSMYDLPLTLKTYVPDKWSSVTVRQGTHSKTIDVTRHDEKGNYVLYQMEPNGPNVILSGN